MSFWVYFGLFLAACALVYFGLSINGRSEGADGHGGHGHDDHGHGGHGHH